MRAEDIPASITNPCTSAPWLTPNSSKRAATVLAYYWPAIAEHFAQLLQEEDPNHSTEFSNGVAWAADAIRNH